MIAAEFLAAVGGIAVTAAPAAVMLRRVRAQLGAVRTECKVARYDATHDKLTGLLNRAGLDAALAARADSGRPWSMVMFDLDKFKQVNDTFGHDAGDEVLIEASFRLWAAFDRQGDQVGRLSGDEFVVLTDNTLELTATTWVRTLHALTALTSTPVELESGQGVTVTASVGVVQVLPGAHLARVRRSVDIAVYRAKARGGNLICEYGLPGELATVSEGRPGTRLRDRNPSVLWAVNR